jgi:glutathione S-transferase
MKKTIWIWPRGLYPGQMHFYLKAKSLPLSVLNTPDNPDGLLTIVPIRIDPEVARLVLTFPDTEPQPPDSLLPVMKIVDGDTTRILHQSTAIVQYLEESYPPSEGYKDLSGGGSLELKAHVQAIVQLVMDAMIWMQADIFHVHDFAVTLGQITKEEQSMAASVYAKKRWRRELAKLDRWVQKLDQERAPISLAGDLDTPTIADFTLLSAVELFKDFFDTDVLEGFSALQVWYKRYTESQWWIPREEVDALGESGYVKLFRG